MPAAHAPTVAEVVAALDSCYPPQLAEPWDAVGLVCGEPEARVTRVLFAVDPAPEVAEEAVRAGAELLVTHHPLLLRPVHSVAADRPAGRVLRSLIRAGVALFVAHTNADSARPGVSDALAGAVGLPGNELEALSPRALPAQKLVTFVPPADVDAVIDALAAAGAGVLGEYRRCAFLATGTGTFEPGAGAHPTVGRPGQREQVAETRVEMLLPAGARPAVVAALRAAHPYEEPAFEVYDVAEPAAGAAGLGRVGELPRPLPLAELAARVTARLPATAGGIRVAGAPKRPVRRLAVCGGSGGDLGAEAAARGADALLTSDLRHHQAQDLVAETGLAVLDAAHWATEWPWLAGAAARLKAALPPGVTVETTVSTWRTDPWTMLMPEPAGEPH